MIVVDTSALMAVVLDEAASQACDTSLIETPELSISAATLAEALIVASRRGVGEPMARLLDGLRLTVVPVTEAAARDAARAHDAWGKGVHPARLNFGDCFAYALAERLACPLLYIGEDFARTDIVSAL